MGPVTGMGIMSYNADAGAYTYYGVDSLGMTMTSIPQGTVDGNTWTFNDESMMGGTTVKSRFVMEVTSETSYTFKWEMQGPDGSWMTVMSGSGKKS